jgi:UDP-N-acetylmuramoylalanine--D-glutamate ligase
MIDLSGLAGVNADVLGLGRTGLAAARALAAGGARVRVWDDGAAARGKAEAEGFEVSESVGGPPADMLVLSPGIPHTHPRPHPVAARARAANINILSDIELLWRAAKSSRYVGITGTNGKSTTTALVGHVLERAGRTVAVGGNLGTAVLSLPELGGEGTYVLELSSYQLELMPTAVLDVAVLLNVSPDHLDRHGGMDGYVAAKARIFQGGTDRPGAVAIVGVDDAWSDGVLAAIAPRGERRIVPISVVRAVAGGVHAVDGRLVDDTDGRADAVIDLATVPALPGRHNWQNACAAYAACRAAGLDADAIVAGLRTFAGLAHRQQLLATIGGVRFVNDSKATNADAADKALGCYDDIFWIVGGRPKAGGLGGLEPHMPRIRRAFLIGEAEEAFAAWLDGRAPYERSGDLATATHAAFAAARASGRPDPVVLLSPACASFDQFPDFEVRGAAFAAIVAALGGTAR